MKAKKLFPKKGEINSLITKPSVKLAKESFVSVPFNKLLTLEYNDIMSKQTIKGKI
jgi:hypothetical protein